MTVDEEKRALRARVRAAERALNEDEKAAGSAAICRALLSLPAFSAAETVLAFCGTAHEIDTRQFLLETLARGKTLCLPRCEPERALSLCVVRDPGADLTPGAYGILEPSRACPVLTPEEIGFAVVPCLSFDRRGSRLGQGGGYYDRLLPRLRCPTACVCREALVLPAVPRGEHDARCTLYVTERGVMELL